jgi:hypothetical protein
MYGAAYGVIADIATIDERGSFVGVLLLMWVLDTPFAWTTS